MTGNQEIKRLVLEFEASGLRQNEFCRNQGLALSVGTYFQCRYGSATAAIQRPKSGAETSNPG
jgi:hypothetical protein